MNNIFVYIVAVLTAIIISLALLISGCDTAPAQAQNILSPGCTITLRDITNALNEMDPGDRDAVISQVNDDVKTAFARAYFDDLYNHIISKCVDYLPTLTKLSQNKRVTKAEMDELRASDCAIGAIERVRDVVPDPLMPLFSEYFD